MVILSEEAIPIFSPFFTSFLRKGQLLLAKICSFLKNGPIWQNYISQRGTQEFMFFPCVKLMENMDLIGKEAGGIY